MERTIIGTRQLNAANDVHFATDILKDVVSQGYSGDELISEFAAQYIKLKKAVNRLHAEADRIVTGETKSITTLELFGEA